jgi:hypothetical protein
VAYHLECPGNCSLRSGTKFGDKASSLLYEGKTYRAVIGIAAKEGVTLNTGTLFRHRKHVISDDVPLPEDDVKPATNIEILEAIISKGFANRKNWKPTIGDTMKAMDMWFRLTQGNPFDDLLDTLAQAGIQNENPASEGTSDEQETIIDSGG